MNTPTQNKAETCADFFDMMEETVSFFNEEYGISAEEVYLMTLQFSQIKLDKLTSMKKALTND